MLLTLLNSRGETISITYKPDGIHIAVGNKEDELLILDVRKFKPIHWRKITYQQVLLRYWVIHLLSCFTLWWLVRQVALISQLISYEVAVFRPGSRVHQILCKAATNTVEWNLKYNFLAYAGDGKNKDQADRGARFPAIGRQRRLAATIIISFYFSFHFAWIGLIKCLHILALYICIILVSSITLFPLLSLLDSRLTS
ncbi:THO complex subunit 3 isoform X4 [Elaeis guineensis]